MSIKRKLFGRTKSGQDVYIYTLENKNGMRAEIIEYGCIIHSIVLPDRTGVERDVVLGCQTLEDYENGFGAIGSIVGRVANRIENGVFTVGGRTYQLETGRGKHHVHGVFGRTVFRGSADGDKLMLDYLSPDGEDGFPGNLNVRVTYSLTDENGLVIDYTATTDQPTIVNLTNHSYFNLDGEGSPSMLDQILTIYASGVCENDADTCPTGRILPVAGTPFDFTQPKPIGRDIFSDDEQIKMARGYDHNFVFDKKPGELGLVATAYSERTGIVMDTFTTQPAMQFFTAGFLGAIPRPGKNGARRSNYQGFCQETQHYPCTPSHPEFPSIDLFPGDRYHETTIYRFGVR